MDDKAKKIKELRESTGMNRKEFCEYFNSPYRTATEWERDMRHAPDYVVRLLEYYIRMEKLMKKKTGYKMDRYFRPPYGSFSIRVLDTVKKLGYRTVLWSNAWLDYDNAHQPSVSSVVDKFRYRYHKGMIPLMHITSSADTAALPQIISFMKSKNYKFCTFE